MSDILERYRDTLNTSRLAAGTAFPHWQLLDELAQEVARMRSGGCAREQGTTQFCGEAARLAQENLRLHAVAIQCEAEAVELRRAVDALALEVAALRELQRAYGDGPLSKRGYAYVVRLNTDCVEAAIDAVREQMPKACAMIAEAKAREESAQGGGQ